MSSPEVVALARADALRAIERQATRLDELRGRALATLSVASVLIGLQGLSSAGAERWATVAAAIPLVIVASTAIAVLQPKKGWRFSASPRSLMSHVTEAKNLEEYESWSLEDLADDHDSNEELLVRVVKFVRSGVWGLVAQVVVLLTALLITSGGSDAERSPSEPTAIEAEPASDAAPTAAITVSP